MKETDSTMKLVGDVAAAVTAFSGWLVVNMPAVATWLAAIYTALRIYEWIHTRYFKKTPPSPSSE